MTITIITKHVIVLKKSIRDWNKLECCNNNTKHKYIYFLCIFHAHFSICNVFTNMTWNCNVDSCRSAEFRNNILFEQTLLHQATQFYVELQNKHILFLEVNEGTSLYIPQIYAYCTVCIFTYCWCNSLTIGPQNIHILFSCLILKNKEFSSSIDARTHMFVSVNDKFW